MFEYIMKDDQSSKKKKRKKNINKKLNEKPNKSIKITEKKTNPNSFSSHSTFSRDFEISEKEIEEFRKKLKDNSIPAHLTVKIKPNTSKEWNRNILQNLKIE